MKPLTRSRALRGRADCNTWSANSRNVNPSGRALRGRADCNYSSDHDDSSKHPSRPSRARGLQLTELPPRSTELCVAPFAGARIATTKQQHQKDAR